jgi:hypothetical protein
MPGGRLPLPRSQEANGVSIALNRGKRVFLIAVFNLIASFHLVDRHRLPGYSNLFCRQGVIIVSWMNRKAMAEGCRVGPTPLQGGGG